MFPMTGFDMVRLNSYYLKRVGELNSLNNVKHPARRGGGGQLPPSGGNSTL